MAFSAPLSRKSVEKAAQVAARVNPGAAALSALGLIQRKAILRSHSHLARFCFCAHPAPRASQLNVARAFLRILKAF